MLAIRQLEFAEAVSRLPELCAVLVDAVASGASVGFLAPLDPAAAAEYWRVVLSAVETGKRILTVAEQGGRIVGTVQLGLSTAANGLHRAEVMKLLVHTSYRGHGIAKLLMAAVEKQALDHQRSLLVLDTRQGDTAEKLYEWLGWQRAGVIPGYARGSSGELQSTVFFYKTLR